MAKGTSFAPEIIRRKAALTELFQEAGYQVRENGCEFVIDWLPTGVAAFSKYKLPAGQFIGWGNNTRGVIKKRDGEDLYAPLDKFLTEHGIKHTGGGNTNDKLGVAVKSGDSKMPYKASISTIIVFDLRQEKLDSFIEEVRSGQLTIPPLPEQYRTASPNIS